MAVSCSHNLAKGFVFQLRGSLVSSSSIAGRFTKPGYLEHSALHSIKNASSKKPTKNLIVDKKKQSHESFKTNSVNSLVELGTESYIQILLDVCAKISSVLTKQLCRK